MYTILNAQPQDLAVHHKGMPDLFKDKGKKYTDRRTYHTPGFITGRFTTRH